MSTPLAAGYRETPLWTDEHPLAERPAADLPARADAVVIGGGYCGLAAATDSKTFVHLGGTFAETLDLGAGPVSAGGRRPR